jgi:hypothetical protein
MMLDKAALLVRILKRPAGDIVPTCGLSSRPARDWTETEKKDHYYFIFSKRRTDSYFGHRRPPKKE